MNSRWRQVAMEFVEHGLMEYEAQVLSLNEPIDPQECKRWISRKNTPSVEDKAIPIESGSVSANRFRYFSKLTDPCGSIDSGEGRPSTSDRHHQAQAKYQYSMKEISNDHRQSL